MENKNKWTYLSLLLLLLLSSYRLESTVVWDDSVFGRWRLWSPRQSVGLDLHTAGRPSQNHHGKNRTEPDQIRFNQIRKLDHILQDTRWQCGSVDRQVMFYIKFKEKDTLWVFLKFSFRKHLKWTKCCDVWVEYNTFQTVWSFTCCQICNMNWICRNRETGFRVTNCCISAQFKIVYLWRVWCQYWT